MNRYVRAKDSIIVDLEKITTVGEHKDSNGDRFLDVYTSDSKENDFSIYGNDEVDAFLKALFLYGEK